MAKKFKLVFAEHFKPEQILCKSDSLSEVFSVASSHLSLYEDLESFLKSCNYFQIDDFDDDCLISLHLLLFESNGSISFSKLSEMFN